MTFRQHLVRAAMSVDLAMKLILISLVPPTVMAIYNTG